MFTISQKKHDFSTIFMDRPVARSSRLKLVNWRSRQQASGRELSSTSMFAAKPLFAPHIRDSWQVVLTGVRRWGR